MDCVLTCEYCKSINVPIDGPNCSITGYYCSKLNRLVMINKPVEKDCPFYFPGYSYKDIIGFKERLASQLNAHIENFMGLSWVPVTAINKVFNEEFDKLLDNK